MHREAPLYLRVVVAPALGLWQNRQDPFFLHGGFPWLVLPPLITSLRYGFAHGLGSAATLCLVLLAFARRHHPAVPAFPGSLAIGLLLTAMITGEFRDMWQRKLHRLHELSEYHQVLLQKFSRSYHLLATSHDRLERRVRQVAHSHGRRSLVTRLGVALVGLGGSALSVNGSCVPDSFVGDQCQNIYMTTGIGTGLIVSGVLLVAGGVTLLALPGKRHQVVVSPASNSQ